MVTSCFVLLSVFIAFSKGDLTDYVDGYIGTSNWPGSDASVTANFGNTIPQLGVPFAHSPFSPQTRATEDKCQSPYFYDDEYFMGFRKTHFMSGSCVIEYGSVSVIPSLTPNMADATTAHRLDHSKETWTPYSYEIDLPESGMKLSATGDNTAGLVKVDVADAKSPTFFIIIASFDTQYNESTIDITSPSGVLVSNPVHRWYLQTGESAGFSGHHAVSFSADAISYGMIEDGYLVKEGATHGQSSAEFGTVAAYFEFDATKTDAAQVLVAVGSSFVSREKAQTNLEIELIQGPNTGDLFDFDAVSTKVRGVWNDRLATLKVTESENRTDFNETASESSKTVFYTALWHSLLLPRMAADADGEYLSFDGSGKTISGTNFKYMDDFSQWDIYRATIPLQFLIAADIVPDMVQSLVSKAEEGGWLPMFPAWNSYTQEMIGDHCSVLIVDAILKGLIPTSGTDAAALAEYYYRIMRRNALEVPPLSQYAQGKGRRGIASYLELGYVPLEDPIPLPTHSNEQVSRTLEYAYNDYVLAQLALKLDHMDDYNTLLKHSENYRNVIDSGPEGVGFARGKHLNGSWVGTNEEFDPDYEKYSWITEGSPYQYSWYVPHQVEQLIELFGGDDNYVQKLDTFFDGGSYNHGNEPDHQAIFMYSYASGTEYGSWRVQERARDVLNTQYFDGAGGLAGNDDAGQTSSWYVLAALGFYPVCPGCGGYSEYTLTTPLFDKAIIHPCSFSPASSDCDTATSFTITAMKTSKADIYIQSARLNGADYDCAFLPHFSIISGGSLEFTLGDAPNKDWGNSGRSCLDKYFGTGPTVS